MIPPDILDEQNMSINLKLFEKREKIGQGGYSKVYKVQDKNSGKIYAAKILLKELNDKRKKELNDFVKEVSFLSNFNHPLLLKLIGVSATNFKDKPKPVIITEFCPKGSLNDVIHNESEYLDDTKKLIFIYGIAEAMSYIHSNGIIHRDLKTENVLSDENFYPKISDFGLSIRIPENSAGMTFIESQICGTPAYTAPEVWKDGEYSRASDVYAFSLIVYEIMTNKKPLTEFSSNAQLLYNVAIKNYRPEINQSIPESYKMLIENCWNQNPEKRPTFSKIVSIIRKDKGFITDETDEMKINEFIHSILLKKSENDIKSYSEMIFKELEEQKRKMQSLEEHMLNLQGLPNECSQRKSSNVSSFGSIIGSAFSWIKSLFSRNQENKSDQIDNDSEIEETQIDHDEDTNNNEIILISELVKETQNGNAKAMLKLGEMYYKGESVSVDKEKAKEYYKMAADLENTDAMNNYAWILIEEKRTQDSINEAKSYLEKAVNMGNMTAMRNYIKLLDELENGSFNSTF